MRTNFNFNLVADSVPVKTPWEYVYKSLHGNMLRVIGAIFTDRPLGIVRDILSPAGSSVSFFEFSGVACEPSYR